MASESELHHQLLEAVEKYHMPEAALELLQKNSPLIISGITASGKNSILDYIQRSSDWRHVITHTTRRPREGEKNGENYWFVDEPGMMGLLNSQAMVEANAVHGDTIYGTSIEAYQKVLTGGHKPLLIIDVQGVEQIITQVHGLRPIFLLPPNSQAWMDRLNKRGLMSHVERLNRLRSAQEELETALQSKHFTLIVNDEINVAAHQILSGVVSPAVQEFNRDLSKRLIEHSRAY